MHAERDDRRALKITAIVVAILGSIVLLIIVAMYGLHRMVDAEFLERELTQMVSDATGGLYEVTIDEIEFSLTRRTFEARDVVFLPDEERLEELRGADRPRVRYRITAPRISASGVGRWPLLRHGRLDARVVRLIDPEVTLYIGPPREVPPEEPPEDPPTLHNQIWRELPRIELDRLEAVNARLKIERADRPERFFDRLDSIDITFHKVMVDSAAAVDEGRTLFSEDVEFHMPAQRRHSADGVYVYDIGDVNGSSHAGTLNISSLSFQPDMDDDAYRAQLPHRQDRIRLSTGPVLLAGTDYRAFLDERKFVAARMDVEDFDIDVLTDFRLPEPPVVIPRMPDEYFRGIDTYVRIDTIRVIGGIAAYNEIAADGVRPGRVTFERMFATVYNVTNDSDRMTPATPAVIDARAQLFGAGDLRAHIRYPLLAEGLTLSYSGTLGSMPIEAFNEMLEPVEGVRITSGELDSLTFDVDAVASTASGTLRPIYRDLSIQAVDKVAGEPGLVQRIESFITNLLIIRGTNVPDNEEPAHTGQIDHTREPDDPFFKFLWESLRSGIFDALGV